MWKILTIFLLPFLLISQELEVALPTRSNLKPIYISSTHTQDHDWRFAEDLRSILEYDFNLGGFCSVAERQDHLEQTLQFPDVRSNFNLSVWKKTNISYCLAINATKNHLELTLFNIENGSSKKYPIIKTDRHAIHQLTDTIHKDLFNQEGIASLRLIFTQRKKNPSLDGLEWLSEVCICDIDGANARQLTSDNSYCLSPYFFPNSNEEFFYVSEKSGQSKIYRASLSNPKGKVVIDMRGNQALPTITKQGTQMAFISDLAGRPDLFVQNFDRKGEMLGKSRQLYSAPRATQATPTYSPDGKKIAFVSDRDGPPRVYSLEVVNHKATKRIRPQLITKKNRENTSPSWSPDGTKLAYSAKVDGFRQIWIYDFATGEEVQLTTGPENKENPSWAPDNFHLVYNTESSDNCELYLIHINQGEPIQVIKAPGQKRFASWEPRITK